MNTQTPFEKQKIEEFREKYISPWIVDDGADNMLWNKKAPSANEVLNFLQTALREQREMIEKEQLMFLGTIISQMGGELRIRPSHFVRLPLKFEIERYDDPRTGELVYRLNKSLTPQESEVKPETNE